jgi:hypothetical protein
LGAGVAVTVPVLDAVPVPADDAVPLLLPPKEDGVGVGVGVGVGAQAAAPGTNEQSSWERKYQLLALEPSVLPR